MSNFESHPIGNPVDTWWNSVRQEIDLCIDMLGQFPPVQNSTAALEMLPAVSRAYQHVESIGCPQQATKIREFLLESLQYLMQSLKEQVAHGRLAQDSSHNMAYHKFLMVSYFLLQRGIYEPEPTSYQKRRVS